MLINHTNPVKKERYVLFVVVCLLTAAMLSGCNGEPARQGRSEAGGTTTSVTSTTTPTSTPATTTTEPTTSPTSSESSQPGNLPDPVTGIYNGQTITMRYLAITDYIWPEDNLRPGYFQNGFAHFYYYGSKPDKENYVGGAYLDKSGRMICQPIYTAVTPFHADGLALVQKETEGPWVYIDSAGVEKGICDDPAFQWLPDLADSDGFVNGMKIQRQNDNASAFVVVNQQNEVVAALPDGVMEAYFIADGVICCQYGDVEDGPAGKYSQLLDINGKLLSNEKFSRVGKSYNGLAPFIQDGKLGILDEKGNVIIPASFPIKTNFYDSFVLNEDLLLVNVDGCIGVVEITRK